MLKNCRIILAMLLILLCLSVTAAQAAVTDSGIVLFAGKGDTFTPDLSRLAGKIGEGLTDADFRITYGNASSEALTVHKDGSLTVGTDMYTPALYTYTARYVPRGNKGKTTEFQIKVRVYEPLESFTIQEEDITLAVGETATLTVDQMDGTVPGFKESGYDPAIVKADFKPKGDIYAADGSLNLTGVAPGVTEVTLTGHNNVARTVRVTVMEPPSYVEITADKPVCYVGDEVKLNVELGGDCYQGLRVWITRNTYWDSDCDKWLSEDYSTFRPEEAGRYVIKLTTYNGHSGTVQVDVYDKAVTTYLQPLDKPMKVGFSQVLKVMDVNGKSLTVPLEIIEGKELAEVTAMNTILPKAAGFITVRVTAVSGMTHEMTYEIVESPTSMTMPYTTLYMKVGDTANIMPIFDKGTAEVTWFTTDITQNKPYQETVISLSKDGNVTALSPGQVNVLAQVEGITGYGDCTIIVEDSEKTLVIDQPAQAFGVNHSYQLRVLDKAGNVYPATFETQPGFEYVEISADGVMTGVREGEAWIIATLENGHTIKFKQKVIQIPTKLSAGNVVYNLNDSQCYLPTIMSDVGALALTEVRIEIANPEIANFINGSFTLLQVGSTQVFVTAINGGATCTFTVTVEPPTDQLYPEATSISVPNGYSVPLPRVRDYYGNYIDVTYEITGPNEVTSTGGKAFSIVSGQNDVDYIRCYWPSYTTTVTATTKDGRKFNIRVDAYRLPDKIGFWEPEITLQPGKTQQVELRIYEQGYQLGSVTWSLKGGDVVRFMEANPDTGRPCVTALKEGTATLRAELRNGAAAECKITVTAGEVALEPPQSLTLSTENEIRALAGGTTLQILLRHYPGTSSNAVTWSVDNEAAGKVDQDGLFTAAKPEYDQTVNIIATSVADPSVSASYTLTVLGSSDVLKGDVNGDGTVDGRDSVRLLRYLVGEGVAIVEANADMTGDGIIDGRDSLRLLTSLI